MRAVSLRAVGSAALVLWLILIVTSYYVVHKPFGPHNAAALLDRAADLVSTGALVLLAAAAGRRILARTHVTDRLERLLFSAGLGLGLASLVTLGLVWIGLPGRGWGYLGSALLAVVLRNEILAIGSDLRALRSIRMPDRPSRFLAGYVAAAMGFALALALLPPTAWDSLLYHLKGPSLLLGGASFDRVLRIVPLGYSSLLEHLYLLGMWLRGDGVAAPLHWLFALLTLGAAWRLSAALDIIHRWLTLGLLLSGLTWVLLAGWPYVDWGMAFYVTAAVLAVMRWAQDRTRDWLILCGAFVGLALSVKYTGLYAAAAVGAILLNEARRDGARSVAQEAGTLVLTSLPFFVPFLVRNWIFAGNPVYPYVWGGLDLDPLREWRLTRPEMGLAMDPLGLLATPIEATLLGAEGKVGFEATIGPLFLGLLPLAGVAAFRDSPPGIGRRAGFALAVLYALWIAGLASSPFFQNLRLAFAMFPLLAVLAAAGLSGVREWRFPAFSLHRVLGALIATVLTLNLARFGLQLVEANPWAYLLGEQSREEYLADHLGSYYDAMTYFNQELPPPARVQFLWEPRSYYCDVDCRPDATLDRFSDLVFRHQDPGAIAEQIHQGGTTHLLLFETGMSYMAETDPAALPAADLAKLRELLAGHFQPIRTFGTEYTLYAWR